MDVHNLGGGFNGVACPLNPSQESVLGTQCYPEVARVPNTPDLAIICSFLLNSGHADSDSIAVGEPRPFVFDERLRRRRP